MTEFTIEIAVREAYYLCLGDNAWEYEKISPKLLIGVVSAFKRTE